jgi:hypothetical protein
MIKSRSLVGIPTRITQFVSHAIWYLLAVFLIPGILLSQDRSDVSGGKANRLREFAEAARAKGKSTVRLPPPEEFTGDPRNLAEALSGSSLIVGKLIAQETVPERSWIATWYKYKIVEFLHKQENTPPGDLSSSDIPPSLLPLRSDEILVHRNVGSVVVEGVNLTTIEDDGTILPPSLPHVLFLVLRDSGKVGLPAYGPQGMFILNADQSLQSGRRTAAAHSTFSDDLVAFYGHSIADLRDAVKQYSRR